MAETSDYPGSLDTFIDFEAKRDLVDKAHINKIQNAIEAMQTELGTDPAGSVTDVKTRLFVCIGNNGALRQGTSFPGSPIEGQTFWRTDEKVFYVYDATAGTWRSAQSYSNTLFQFNASIDSVGTLYVGNTLLPAAIDVNYEFHVTDQETYTTVRSTKFKKLATVNTVTVHAQLWMQNSDNGNEAVDLKVDIGGQNGTVGRVAGDASPTVPTWMSFTIDISSLTTGTVYDVTVQIKRTGTLNCVYMGNLIAFGS